MKKTFCFIALILFLSSCSSNDANVGDTSFYSSSFITEYFDATNLTVQQTSQGSNYCKIVILGDQLNGLTDKFSKQHNDTHYNKYKLCDDYAVADSILSIDVKCNEALDANHPAGSSVSDVMTFHWVTANDYVNSGYKKYESIIDFYLKNDSLPHKYQSLVSCFSVYSNREGYSYHKDFANMVKANETKLIAPYTSLELNTIPKAGTYHFTINMKMSDKILSYKFEMSF